MKQSNIMAEKFRVIIAGGRDFDNFRFLCKTAMHLLQNKENVEIVSGCARGADELGEKFGKFMGFPIKQFPANWDEFGKAAGHIRNKEMAKYSDALIAFWDGESRGTANMIEEAEKLNLKVVVKKYKVTKVVTKPWYE